MKLIDNLLTLKYTLYEKIAHERWLTNPSIAKCQICGKVINSLEHGYSPEESGWARVKDIYGYKTWICHQCLSHRDFKPYIKQVDEDERKIWEKMKNE